MSSSSSAERDLHAIKALNQQDMRASLSGDIATLTSQWTEDFVMLPPSGPVVRGRSTNAELAERGKEQMSALEPLDYVVEFEEIKVVGEYAFEWGTYRGSLRPRSGGATLTYGGKLMRILQRQPDGSWKMHRTMTTSDSAAR